MLSAERFGCVNMAAIILLQKKFFLNLTSRKYFANLKPKKFGNLEPKNVGNLMAKTVRISRQKVLECYTTKMLQISHCYP